MCSCGQKYPYRCRVWETIFANDGRGFSIYSLRLAVSQKYRSCHVDKLQAKLHLPYTPNMAHVNAPWVHFLSPSGKMLQRTVPVIPPQLVAGAGDAETHTASGSADPHIRPVHDGSGNSIGSVQTLSPLRTTQQEKPILVHSRKHACPVSPYQSPTSCRSPCPTTMTATSPVNFAGSPWLLPKSRQETTQLA